jgi:catechol 2,3-dioxygenase-like lactoylglutathione lyase family enzyme
MHDETRIPRREFLTRGAKLAAGAAAAPYLLAPGRALASNGQGVGQLGLVGTDHVGLTVPDINQAIEWFEDVMGAVAPLTFGPISDPTGTLMHDLLDVDPRAGIDKITMLRIGRSANIELFQYEAPGQRRDHPRNSDWSGHHVAFYVKDIGVAVEYMQSRGVEKFLGPLPITDGPAAGQTINYFRTPFGTFIELISYPHGMAYEKTTSPRDRLWSPKENGQVADVTKVPGLLGIDHIGITVPDIAQAIAWFENVLGYSEPLTFGPLADPVGTFIHDVVGTDPRAVIQQITEGRGGNGPNVELFSYTAPDQDRTFRRNSDWGGHHIAFYVRDIDKAVDWMVRKGVTKLLGPFAVADGPAAGQTINYFKAPFEFVELISYPHGMAYEKTARIKLWDPRDNQN